MSSDATDSLKLHTMIIMHVERHDPFVRRLGPEQAAQYGVKEGSATYGIEPDWCEHLDEAANMLRVDGYTVTVEPPRKEDGARLIHLSWPKDHEHNPRPPAISDKKARALLGDTKE